MGLGFCRGHGEVFGDVGGAFIRCEMCGDGRHADEDGGGGVDGFAGYGIISFGGFAETGSLPIEDCVGVCIWGGHWERVVIECVC